MLDTGIQSFRTVPSKTFKGLTAFVFINLVPNLDPSVKHWDDKKGSTGIFVQYLYISHASEQIQNSTRAAAIK
ncbi:MAG: hypothetical protein TV42_05920 [Wolbachia endosymbiont of Dactylopius coccus]|nr:MAG: hypothetical protein TV42_05920 [Wolbachia endosymbiont of Dactylopius coccus]